MVLLIDGGDFFSGSKLQDSIKAEYLAKGMRGLGYHAVALGELDLLHGQRYLLDLARRNDLELVCANVYYAGGEERFVKPYVVRRLGARKILGIETGGVRVAITSVLRLDDGARIEPIVKGEPELIVKDPTISARSIVQELRSKADVIVCMAHTGMDPAKEVAQGVGGVDVMPVGHGNFRNKETVFVGKTALMQPGDQGRMIAVFDAKLTEQKRVSAVSGRLVALDDAYPDAEAMVAVIDEYKTVIRAANIAPDWPGMDDVQYLGTDACVGCHTGEHEQWLTTRHAKAWETLVKENVDRDLECVPCHVTGFGQFNGFRRQDLTPTLKDVQCEVCHGPGKAHVDLITGGGDRKSVELHGLQQMTAKMCATCHRDEHDPTFNYNADIFHVAHRPEELRRKLAEAMAADAHGEPPARSE